MHFQPAAKTRPEEVSGAVNGHLRALQPADALDQTPPQRCCSSSQKLLGDSIPENPTMVARHGPSVRIIRAWNVTMLPLHKPARQLSPLRRSRNGICSPLALSTSSRPEPRDLQTLFLSTHVPRSFRDQISPIAQIFRPPASVVEIGSHLPGQTETSCAHRCT